MFIPDGKNYRELKTNEIAISRKDICIRKYDFKLAGFESQEFEWVQGIAGMTGERMKESAYLIFRENHNYDIII